MSRTASMTGPSSRYQAFRRERRFGSLDGLRALSVVAVIWHHTVGRDPDLPTLFANGAHGVTLFFAISGFLIVTLLLREKDASGHISLQAFYMRRSLRIFPLYYVVLGTYALLVVVVERHSVAGQEFFRNLPFFATYTSNWFIALDGRVIFYFAWSLAAEEQFYLMWPWAEKYLAPLRRLAVMGLVIVFFAWLQTFAHPGAGPGAAWWQRLVANFPLAICFGVVLAHLLHHERTHAALRWLFGWRASSVLCALLALAMLQWAESWPVAVHLSMALLVGACVYREDHGLAPLLRLPALAFVGSVSYGVYLLHMLVKNALTKGLLYLGWPASKYWVFGLTVIGAVAVAALSFRYFESFFLRRKQRYARAPTSAATPAPTPDIGGSARWNQG